MSRQYRIVPTSQLLDLSHSSSESVSVLQAVIAELQERKNDRALHALIEVGALLERALEEERIRRRHQQQAERLRVLRLKEEGFFEWPSTDAPASIYGFSGDQFFYKDGLLSYVGYRVGRNGAPQDTRLQILDCVFHNELPNVDSAEYMEGWGSPNTTARLQKIAESIAAFTRNAKRNRGHDYSEAITNWEGDLGYLYDEYYVDRFRFGWPPRS